MAPHAAGSPQRDAPEAIAIIGMGCRFPGESNTPDEFWNMLLEKRNGRSRPPLSRFNIDGFQSNKKRPGSIRPEGAYFVSDSIYDFDAPFFSITKPEAETMDPQQRKLLETVYEALEQGGITLESISGSNTGVYVGNFNYDYGVQTLRDADFIPDYSMTGQGVTLLANRVSYVFNLSGPSVTLDTACSSSMYAAHVACRALCSGEIDGAIIGGTNLIQSVENHMSTDAMGVLSATSTSHTFDDSADGYGRGEGVGAIYMKRMSDALRDGDPIRGVIRGTAVNANGRTSGITQPSATRQSAAIRDAYKFAGISSLDDTGYFETHGTGTAVGDPIELRGIANAFVSKDKPRRSPLLLGGVKPNVGHAEAASAIESILKVAYVLEQGTIPATIGIKTLNPQLEFCGGELQVVRENRDWPIEYELRRASINSFGYGGANGHAIMESASSVLPGYQSFKTRETSSRDIDTGKITGTMGSGEYTFFTKERTQFLVPFSAHDTHSLRDNIAAVRDVADQYDTSDLAYTLAARRSRFFHRGCAVVDRVSVRHDLEDQAITTGKRSNGNNIVLVFNGQGAQSAQMGKDLMQDFSTYLQTIRELDKVLQGLGRDAPLWSLEDELLTAKVASRVDEAQLSQPLCTAVQIALVDLLDRWNVEAKATVGHSSGDIAAAYAAGSITKAQAITVAYFRGLAVSSLQKAGLMIAVGLSPEECEPYLEDGVVIACYNSPTSVTLSGDADVVANVQAKLEADNIFARVVNTGGRAYHSHHVKGSAVSYRESMQRAFKLHGTDESTSRTSSRSHSPVYSSSVYGTIMEKGFVPGPEYWTQNLESPVLFTQALHTLLSDASLALDTIIEIGPHCSLAGPIRQLRDQLGMKHGELEYAPSLVRGRNATTSLLNLAGALFIKGHDINLTAVNAIECARDGTIVRSVGKIIVDLPAYRWNYRNGTGLRLQNRLTDDYRLRKFPRHDLLGSKVPGAIRDRPQWRNILDLKHLSWLDQHKLSAQPVFPAMGYIAIAMEAARQFFSEFAVFRTSFRYVLPQVIIKAALNLPPAGTHVEILTSMQFQQITDSVTSKDTAIFSIQTCSNGVWTEHATGSIKIEQGELLRPLCQESQLQEPKTAHTWYRGFSSVDLNYGAAFSGLSDIRSDPWANQVTALTKLLPTGVDRDDSRYLVHPATMDTCIQATLIAAHRGSLKDLHHSFIPVSMENMVVWNYNGRDIPAIQPANGRVLAMGDKTGMRKLTGTVQLFDSEDRPLLAIDKVNAVTYAEKLIAETPPDSHPYLRVVWKPDVDHPNAFATSTRLPHNLLRMWAEGLVSTAKTRPTQPLSKAILEALPGDFATPVTDHPALDFGDEGVGEEIFELESLVLGAFQHLGKDYRPDNEVMPGTFQKALDLVTHKRPNLDILLLVDGNNTGLFRTIESTLKSKSSLKRYRTLDIVVTNGKANPSLVQSLADFRQVLFTENNIFAFPDEMATAYDLIVIAHPPSFLQNPIILSEFINDTKRHLKEQGRILVAEGRRDLDAGTGHVLDTIVSGLGGYFSNPSFDKWSEAVKKQDFEVRFAETQPSGWTLLTAEVPIQQRTPDVILLSRQEDSMATGVFQNCLKKAGLQVSRACLASHNFVAEEDVTYVSIVEFGDNLFDTLDPVELENLQSIANKAGTVLWVTTGNLLGEANAYAAAILGLARTLQNENPALHFYTIDLDHKDAGLGACQVAYLLHSIDANEVAGDNEFVVKDGAYYVSRLSEDATLDSENQKRISNKLIRKAVTAGTPVRLTTERVGALDTLHFVADDRDLSLNVGQVEVEVRSVGVSMREISSFQGTTDFDSHCCEGAGIVRRVAPGVTKVAVGDFVTWVGKGAFANVERFDATNVHKLSPRDKLEVVAAMPLAFSTAVYGLLHRGRLQWRERVLIHSATGDVGLAAIQVAKMVGAEIFATVSTEKQKAFLMKHYGLDNGHVCSSADTKFAREIMSMTKGNGIDVCLNSLKGERLHASWGLMAVDGRHIYIGSADALDHGDLDFEVFKRSATFTAFDLANLAKERPLVLAGVIQEVLRYYRAGKIRPLHPSYTCSASDVDVTFQQFSHGDHIGKLVVNFDNKPLKMKQTAGGIKFRSDGTYLLVGCLGGLGRCLSRWMVENGARNLTFLGRSGASSKEAAQLVSRLRARGVTVNVVKGDVSSKADVERAVISSAVPVLGAVQGAMALQDFRFGKLSLDQWHGAARPKIQGTLNLHDALAGQPVEWFVMLSSIAATIGNATQANYCAGNTFMDFFARHRRQQGLPATSVALTMVHEVGFVSQDEKIEQGLGRSGLVGLNEKEFIDLMEMAMLPQPGPTWSGDNHATALLVSGLDPAKLSPDVLTSGNRFWQQSRLGPLAVALEEKSAERSGNGDPGSGLGHDLESVMEVVREYLAKTFMITAEDVDDSKPLIDFGMDSMIAISLRNWVFATYDVKIPTSVIMGVTLSARTLAEQVFAELQAAKAFGGSRAARQTDDAYA
ncbi:hypothetical protein BST61_g897 [Cercospora zeina]